MDDDEFDRILRDLRQRLVESEEFEYHTDVVNRIVDAFETLGFDMAFGVKHELDDAFAEMKRFNDIALRELCSQTPVLPNYSQFVASDDDYDVFMEERPPITRATQANAGSSRERPVTLSPSPPPAAAPARAPPAARAPAARAAPAPAPARAPKRRLIQPEPEEEEEGEGEGETPVSSLKDSEWMNRVMTAQAITMFAFYQKNHGKMHDIVSKRFAVVLRLADYQQQLHQYPQQQQQQQQQQPSAVDVMVDMSVRILDVPHELRPMFVTYADIEARKASEIYNAYLIGKTIHDNVEKESDDQDTPESKENQREEVYKMLRKSFRNLRQGQAFCRLCQRAFQLGEKLGIYTLVLYDVFSRDFLLKNIKNESDLLNVANVINQDKMYPRQVREAKIVDGALIMEDYPVDSTQESQ